MQRLLKALTIAGIAGFMSLGFNSAVYAQAELSCSELSGAIDDIDDISDEVFFMDRIRSGSSLDDALEDVIDVANVVADLEDDRLIDRAIVNLEDAWIAEDWDGYSIALDDMADRLAYFYARDC